MIHFYMPLVLLPAGGSFSPRKKRTPRVLTSGASATMLGYGQRAFSASHTPRTCPRPGGSRRDSIGRRGQLSSGANLEAGGLAGTAYRAARKGFKGLPAHAEGNGTAGRCDKALGPGAWGSFREIVTGRHIPSLTGAAKDRGSCQGTGDALSLKDGGPQS